MPRRALTSLVVALLLLLVPASAFADGAGDDQYQDPLAAPTAPKAPKKKAATTAPTSTSAPAATTTPTATTTPASTSATQPAPSASQQQLPRTGAPAGLLGLGGATLILSGAALRRRTASQ